METIHKEYQGKVPIFYFDPAVRAPRNIKEFQLSLENEIRNDFKNILIDLRNISFINTDFIAAIDNIAHSYRKNGARIGIIIPKEGQYYVTNSLNNINGVEIFYDKYEAVYNYFI